ncbi:hypothetical protein K504DRAFT_473736 [Pleomassaria siparia CBS 279.74]|uniref:BTB domain-containing protein n=1 Tax=Pleomassaria siparia CBS 279.74 TaxID=1314801 RepID=A0A6G1JTA3_9PLEO|nr:hypothetical protein K504DRAFT_473736 [Pleomassaria siparia CBS 279.74]
MAETSRDQMMTSVKELFKSGDYSDLVLTCGNDTYKVHKNIVCTRAKFFAKAIKFPGKESEEGKIDLPEDEPEIVKLLVQYLYEAEPKAKKSAKSLTPQEEEVQRLKSQGYSMIFPHTCKLEFGNCQADQLLTHAKMYEIADKYDVIGLKDLSGEKFRRACQSFWNDAHFPVAANHAFSTTPDHDKGLRDIVCNIISDQMELLDKPEIEALMTEFNGLAFGVLKQKARVYGCLLGLPDHSDFTITCGNDTYKVHKAVVCKRSKFITGAERFAAGTGAENGVLDLPEDDPATIKLLIGYLYFGAYEPDLLAKIAVRENQQNDFSMFAFPHSCNGPVCSSPMICPHHQCERYCGCKNFTCRKCCSSSTGLITHVNMYTIADKYFVSGLGKLSRQRFAAACAYFWDAPEFKDAVRHVYETEPDDDMDLRDIIASTISDHIVLLKKPEIEALMVEFGLLSFKVLQCKAKEHNWIT